MSHRGLSLPVLGLAVLSTCCSLSVFSTNRACAQVLENASELLQKKQSTSPATNDELPAPARPSQAESGPAKKAPSAGNQPSRNQFESGTEDKATAEASPPRIYLGLEAEQAVEGIGVRVASVTRDSPAWKAGFRVDDRILGINGFAIASMEHMIEQLSKTRPGQSVNFLVNREGRNRDLVAVLMSAEVADQIQNRPANLADIPAWLGITASDLSNSFREQFGIAAFRGAAVTQVVNGSPAYQAGIRPGDAIVEAGGKSIESAAELQRWVEQAKPGEQGLMIFYRGAGRQSTKVVLVGDPQQLPPQRPQPQRPQAFPGNSGSVANRPTTPSAKPQQPLPVEPSTSADQNASLVLGADQPEMPASPREQALEAENIELRKQLAEVQAKLAETKQQLDNILRSLKD